MLSNKNYYRLQAWGLIALLNLDMFLMSKAFKCMVALVVALAGFTLLYVASKSCLYDQESLACWFTNGDLATWLHTTWFFNR